MKEPVFRGVGVALVTLFRDDGCLDVPATADHAARLVELGVRAVIVAGTAGEAAALDPEERGELLAAVRKAVPVGGGVPVVAGTGAPSARQASRLTAAARDSGADAILALSPPGTTDSRRYYETVTSAAGGLPVLAYHYPQACPPGIPVETLIGLDVAGLKDSSGDAGRLLATRQAWDRPLYSGSSALLTLAGSIGCAGVILALSNAEPEVCIAAFAGDVAAQLDVAKHRSAEARYPAGVKELVAARFGCSTVTRLG